MAPTEARSSAGPSVADIRKEVMRRANARISPFESVKVEEAQEVVDALRNLEHDHWAELWSGLGERHEARGDELASGTGAGGGVIGAGVTGATGATGAGAAGVTD